MNRQVFIQNDKHIDVRYPFNLGWYEVTDQPEKGMRLIRGQYDVWVFMKNNKYEVSAIFGDNLHGSEEAFFDTQDEAMRWSENWIEEKHNSLLRA